MQANYQDDVEPYVHRQLIRKQSEHKAIWKLLDDVCDPEIPVLSLWDLGVLRSIESKDQQTIITLTPTYSGCPALDVMKTDILSKLRQHNITNVLISISLSPPWSSQDLSPQGREKLEKYGIAPPVANTGQLLCPRCKNPDIQLVSQFGSTPCKALYQCNRCLEPFDHFKNL